MSDFAAVVDRVLTYFSLCESMEPAELDEQGRWIHVPMTYFNGAEPTFAYPDELGSRTLMRSHETLYFQPGAVKWGDLSGIPFDTSILMMASGNENGKQRLYQAKRVRRVPMKEVRGMFRTRTGMLVEHSFATIFKDGKHLPCRYYAEKRGDKWCTIGQPFEVFDQSPVADEDQTSIEMAMSIAFSNFYEWAVWLGFRGFPKIALKTDPQGARAVFRLRDLPPGGGRRAALRHWVESYYRKRPTGSDIDGEAIKVIGHLRGNTDFSWNGLECSIRPSEYDLRRLARLQGDRARRLKISS